MSRSARGTRAAIASVATVATVLGWANVAHSEPHAGVDSYLYRPAVDASGVFTLDGAEALERYDLAFKLGLGLGYRPLALAVPGIGDDSDDPVLSYTLGVHMTLGFALTSRLALVLDTGVYRTDTQDGYGERGRYDPSASASSTGLISLRPLSNIDPSGGFEPQGLSGPLDARAGFKYQIVSGETIDVAVLALARLPFGEDEMFLGDAGFVLSPRLAVEYALDPARTRRVLLNLGAHIRERTVLQAYDPTSEMADDARAVLDVGSELSLGAGLSYRLGSRFNLAGETTLRLPLPSGLALGTCRLVDATRCSDLDDDDYFSGAGYGDLAAYLNAGGQLRTGPETTLEFGLGLGLLGARGDRVRALLGVVWTPVPAGESTLLTGGDRDGDRNPDITDVCPEQAEDEDGFQDGDGCPDVDNDGDGLEDAADTCPNEPEDKDGHLDDDGCPERDNDGDNIADAIDRCIAEPEDFDGFEDSDGCPESDNDGDGIIDTDDRCPNQPETFNNIEDNDGCPDSSTQTGPVEEVDRIDLRGNQITFAGARSTRLTQTSREVLRQIATIIVRRGLRVRIEVHVPLSTRSRNTRTIARAREADKRLAQRRAEAILSYLTGELAVPLPALQAVGIGSARPLEQPATRSVNERVDFIKREQRVPRRRGNP